MIVPLENRIAVRPDTEPEKSEGGVYLTDSAKGEQQRAAGMRGTVIACGIRRIDATGERCDSQVVAGHVVVFSKYAGTEIRQDGEKLVVLREDDILAIVGVSNGK